MNTLSKAGQSKWHHKVLLVSNMCVQIQPILLDCCKPTLFGAGVAEVDLKCCFSGFPGKGAPLAHSPQLGGWWQDVCQPVPQPAPQLDPSRDLCISWALFPPPSQCCALIFLLPYSHENCLWGWRKDDDWGVCLATRCLHVPCSLYNCSVPSFAFPHTDFSINTHV